MQIENKGLCVKGDCVKGGGFIFNFMSKTLLLLGASKINPSPMLIKVGLIFGVVKSNTSKLTEHLAQS